MPSEHAQTDPCLLKLRSRSWTSRADTDKEDWSEGIGRTNESLAALLQVFNAHEETGSLPDSVLRTSASLLELLEQGRLAESRQLAEQILRSNAPLLPSEDYRDSQLKQGKYLSVESLRSVGAPSLRAASTPSHDYKSVVEEALQHGEDAQDYLEKVEARLTTMGVLPPTVTVRFKDLSVETLIHADLSRNLPSVLGFYRSFIEWVLERLRILRPHKRKLVILNGVSGMLQPGRITLLLGPPASGKTTLLKALAGVLNRNGLKFGGSVTYNGKGFHEFIPIRTATYVEQSDTLVGELTVRETLDFAARCQGSGSLKEVLEELKKREAELDIEADRSIDALLQLEAEEGLARSVRTEFIIRMLGLGICADTMVGDRMHRGVSGGQKKRVTSGEMLVAQKRVLFMDEPSTGLDSSTTFQIVKYLRDMTHTQHSTSLISLLQPDPETYHLFDDVLLIAEGAVVYHGPVEYAASYFAKLGFCCPERKGIADFLQEVTSLKDQEQYWSRIDKSYKPVTAAKFSEVYKRSKIGRARQWHLAVEADKEADELNAKALVTTPFALSNWQMFKACWDRELILVKRNLMFYIFRFMNTMLVGLVTAFTFLRTELQPDSLISANRYVSVLFFSMIMLMFDASTEMILGLSRLAGFYKQRDNRFYASWAFVLPTTLLRIPYSFFVAVLWSSVVYYVVGFAPEATRFAYFLCILFLIHSMAVGMFRAAAAIARDPTIAPTAGSVFYLVLLMCGGFLLSKGNIPSWWSWYYWADPLAYAQKAMALNEFSAPRWQISDGGNSTIEDAVLGQRDLPEHGYERWLGLGAVGLACVILNVMIWLGYAHLNALEKPATVLPPAMQEDIATEAAAKRKAPKEKSKRRKAKQAKKDTELRFEPLTLTFRHIDYYVAMPKTMDTTDPDKLGPQLVDVGGVTMLQILQGCSGAFQPGILTAMVGSSGAGKTTLMDVLAGRKTTGKLDGDICISGFPKDQASFARVSGYVEQFDIHSPCTTVGEALWISARLRFGREVPNDTVKIFIRQVEDLVELETLRGSLVGIPGKSGLSVEQRKRLTIATELVANPSLVFMDEPTSGLDARAAAIVMRTVRATADTGRTVVCTIHQPSVDIFEAFDDLLLMRIGGQIIYHGPLGERSARLVNYFEAIPGVPCLREGINPATWMLQISTPVVEKAIGVDFAAEFCHSAAYRELELLLDELEVPPAGSQPLRFRSRYAQPQIVQFWELLKRNSTSYSRSPGYNGTRFIFGAVLGLLFGSLLWQKGQVRATLQDVYNIMGALYLAMLFMSFINSSSVQAIVSYERSVSFRETAAGMYSSLAFGLAACAIEIPYIFLQNALFCTVSYWMIGFEASVTKFFWYLLFIFLNLFLMTNYGIMAVYATPSLPVAGICSSMFFGIWNLFAGYIVPRALMPAWFRWYTYLDPIHWSLYGIITSQLGDISDLMNLGLGLPSVPVQEFLQQEYDYYHSFLPWVAIIMLGYGVAFAFIGVLALQVLKYQKR